MRSSAGTRVSVAGATAAACVAAAAAGTTGCAPRRAPVGELPDLSRVEARGSVLRGAGREVPLHLDPFDPPRLVVAWSVREVVRLPGDPGAAALSDRFLRFAWAFDREPVVAGTRVAVRALPLDARGWVDGDGYAIGAGVLDDAGRLADVVPSAEGGLPASLVRVPPAVPPRAGEGEGAESLPTLERVLDQSFVALPEPGERLGETRCREVRIGPTGAPARPGDERVVRAEECGGWVLAGDLPCRRFTRTPFPDEARALLTALAEEAASRPALPDDVELDVGQVSEVCVDSRTLDLLSAHHEVRTLAVRWGRLVRVTEVADLDPTAPSSARGGAPE